MKLHDLKHAPFWPTLCETYRKYSFEPIETNSTMPISEDTARFLGNFGWPCDPRRPFIIDYVSTRDALKDKTSAQSGNYAVVGFWHGKIIGISEHEVDTVYLFINGKKRYYAGSLVQAICYDLLERAIINKHVEIQPGKPMKTDLYEFWKECERYFENWEPRLWDSPLERGCGTIISAQFFDVYEMLRSTDS